jgi:hypothetical protein
MAETLAATWKRIPRSAYLGREARIRLGRREERQ